jgi:hypothetical protein
VPGLLVSVAGTPNQVRVAIQTKVPDTRRSPFGLCTSLLKLFAGRDQRVCHCYSWARDARVLAVAMDDHGTVFGTRSQTNLRTPMPMPLLSPAVGDLLRVTYEDICSMTLPSAAHRGAEMRSTPWPRIDAAPVTKCSNPPRAFLSNMKFFHRARRLQENLRTVHKLVGEWETEPNPFLLECHLTRMFSLGAWPQIRRHAGRWKALAVPSAGGERLQSLS